MDTNTDVAVAKKIKKETLDRFFESIKDAGEYLSTEELDVAIESLKLAGLEIKEKEDRRRREAEAKRAEALRAEEEKRRAAAAERAAARAEKRHRKHVAEITAMDLPMDWVNSYEDDERTSVAVDSISDGLMVSLDSLGMVDIEFIAAITGAEYKTVIEELRGSIYQNPLFWDECFYKGWETADEYLSGNLMHKYKLAKEANEKYYGYFDNNVAALEGLVEHKIDTNDIYVTLGSPWVPTDIIDEFILHLVDEDPINGQYNQEMIKYFGPEYAVRHDEITGIWEIPNKTRFRKGRLHGMYEEVNYSVFGTSRMDMLYLLENILNMKTVSITDAKEQGGKVRILNHVETVKLLEKQEKMIEEFREWVWEDEKRRDRLQGAYWRKFGNIKRRNYDGSFLAFPNMSDSVELYPYQKNAVARIIMSPNTLLAHDVGSGKTYVMIAAGMELRRLGKSRKNMYVVPNNIIGQWRNIFYEMYPDAKLLIVDNSNFGIKKRSETLRKIKDEDYDAVIMTYSCFDMLSLSNKYYIALHKKQLELLGKAKKAFFRCKKVERKEQIVQKAIDALKKDTAVSVCDIPFEELGINTLFVDEAHNYKNVGVETGINRVLGAGNKGSLKAQGMMDKVHCVQRENNGGRVIFATGTPITNSITDIFIMQKYLQEGELEFLGLHNFDSWAGMFAEKITDFEIDVDTNSYHLATRFSRFCNIPELTSILSSVADFHHVDEQNGIPKIEGYNDSLREGSEDFKNYLRDISNRADDVRHKRVSRLEDNLLKITSDGRKAALDMRLIDEVYGLDPDSKVIRCAENIMEEYENTRAVQGIQLVFCDSSTPKKEFNMYDELKKLLVAMGMPSEQIAFIHDASTEREKEDLFIELRAGRVSVLVGSTFKMGLGVNVQDRMTALHHLDVPWRPADMVQREGRLLRQGNMNESVRIYRYLTKGSFDSYSWQLLETKQRFISQILSGHTMMREGSDIDDAVLNYAEVKALAVGNPLIKRRVELANELDRYRVLHRDYVENRIRMEEELRDIPKRIENQNKKISDCEKDIEVLAANTEDFYDQPYLEQKAFRETIYNAVKNGENLPYETVAGEFCGFKIVVPAYMSPRIVVGKEENNQKNKVIPYVFLRGNGVYRMEIESEAGISKRLNNFCRQHEVKHVDKNTEEIIETEIVPSGIETCLNKFKDELKNLEIRKNVLAKELCKTGGFIKEIEELEAELNRVDEELGVRAS